VLVILLRKMWRDLLGHRAQFVSIFLISLLAVGFYTGITAEYRSMDVSGQDFFEKTDFATVWVFGENFTAENVAAVAAQEDVEKVERLLIYETQANLPGAPTLTLHYREQDEVNRLLVHEGAPFDVNDERVWLDTRFAQAHKLEVGDNLRFTVAGSAVDAQIAGLVYSPELVYPDLGDALTPNYGAHGYAFTGAENFPLPAAAGVVGAAAPGAAVTGAAAADTAAPGAAGALETTPAAAETSPDNTSTTATAPPTAATNTTPPAASVAAAPPPQTQLPYNQLAILAPAWNSRQYELEELVEDVLGSTATTIVVRENHLAFSGLKAESEQHAIFANIFPVLFMFIAVLVMLSTMSRLVSKQSTLIGTMKALGVSKTAITLHYIGYGFIITLVGGVLGAVLGPLLVPELFRPSMTRFFTLPQWKTYREPFFFILPLLMALTAALVSWLSCRRVLAQKPAAAMRPHAPRQARHSPLETLPLWRRLSPGLQLTERDIRRNKLRSAMSTVSAMGVSALLLVAFLTGSVISILVDWQYGAINNFASRAVLADDAEAGATNGAAEGAADAGEDAAAEGAAGVGVGAAEGAIANDVRRQQLIERYKALPLMEQTIEVRLPNDSSTKATGLLQVFESGEQMRVTDSERRILPLKDGEVLLSYGMASNLGLRVGERLEWHCYGESGWHEATVATINRNPLIQGLTMTPQTLESFGIDFEPTVLLSSQMISASEAGIQSVASAEEISTGMDLMMEALVMMTVVMIAVAVLISIFIMYNLSTLTFSEMERELATLKVVGFKRRQIVMLLFSQNLFLSVLGVIPGVPLGWKIADLMLNTTGGTIDIPTILTPGDVLLTLSIIVGLCALVALLLIHKVDRLDMVSSLKAPELVSGTV
jgi:putative ABC transport system permease protein